MLKCSGRRVGKVTRDMQETFRPVSRNFRSSQSSMPPSRSYNISISVLTLTNSMRCSSSRQDSSGPSSAKHGLFANIAYAFLRSRRVKGISEALSRTSPVARNSEGRTPSHRRQDTLRLAFSCTWAIDPYLYVDMIAIPSGSLSTSMCVTALLGDCLVCDNRRRNARLLRSG